MYIEIVELDESFELAIGESTFTLRRLGAEAYREIEKRHTTRRKNNRTGVVNMETDDYAVNEDLLDHMILGWCGIRSPNTGEDVPCTRENKLKLPGVVKIQISEACDSDSISGEGKK